MESNFLKSRFSKHFNQLTYLGMWSGEIVNSKYKKYFGGYQIFWTGFLIASICFQMADLYDVSNNMRKVSYNLCTSVIVIATCIKVIVLHSKMEYVNKLRRDLWLDSEKYSDEEDIVIQDYAFGKLKYISTWFYIAAVLFFPLWIICSYFSYLWGPRELPFPAYLPLNVSSDIEYIPALLYQTSCGSYIIKLAMEVDLSMFSIIIQISAQYKILVKNILKLNEMYEDEEEEGSRFLQSVHLKDILKKREVNKHLKREATKQHLKSVILRHLELLEYADRFEVVFNRSMFVQVFAGSLLIIMNGLQLISTANLVTARFFYQTGYLTVIMLDIFFICHHTTELSRQNTNIGKAVYSTLWYRMDANHQKILCLIITRTQKPLKITCAKLFVVDLTTYLTMLKNIYSWLMLFRQFVSK